MGHDGAGGIPREKNLLREQMLAVTCPDPVSSDRRLRQRLFDLSVYQAADSLFCYVSFGDEPDTHAILEDALRAGKRVSVPLVCENVMEARVIRTMADLRPGPYDFLQPPDDAPVALPETLALVIVPGLAFDRAGHRLGRGGGYYDRYLSGCAASAVALCRREHLVEAVPVLPHDRGVRFVITENELIETSNRA